ncbi:MAG TPA: 30S ribosomal protein S17 [Anaerolineae bacterium]|nr:30S ribosomal protein S17 [Anaerolineae bacterium]
MREQRRKRLVGRVVSNKMDKTVVVKVERLQRHRLYHKVMKKSKKFKAHDAYNSCQVGDLVRIVESRPLSKEKRWIVAEIVERADEPVG